MDKKSQQQIIIKICCVIAAFILWLYTSNDGNTIRTNKISSIPIEIVNSDYLKQSGFVLSPNQDFTTALKITGKPADVYGVKAENFKLQVDLSVYALKKGENKVPITIVNKPSNVNIINDNSMWMTIKVDNYKEKSVPIEVEVRGKNDNELSRNKPILKTDKALISGAEEYVNSVVRAKGLIELRNLQGDITKSVELKAVDKDNREVSEVNINPKNVTVLIPVKKTKEVGVNIKTTGALGKDYTLRGLKLVKGKINITGEPGVLAQINKLDTEPIDLGNIKTENSNVKVKLIIPEGVKLADNSDVVDIEVALDKIDKQNITATLETRNLGNDLTAQLERNTISLVVSGGRNTISEIISKGLKCYVNLNGLGKGEHTVPIIIDIPKGVSLISQNYKRIKVTISDNKNGAEETKNNDGEVKLTNSHNVKKHR
ncbi:CdaR family protein [Clostridium massiliodielmoense]|uniref:CdaR family protein n=1 Tax=Clostridium massiliodielmoense TaxID=1776385 RepID=UPI0004D5FDE9|nr:CdaR family protein [Clostridium massiliodielmoense]KEH96801.1 membrane protein [Clostridium botulinum C/D str. BKT12695]